jgi:hypothetical protein
MPDVGTRWNYLDAENDRERAVLSHGSCHGVRPDSRGHCPVRRIVNNRTSSAHRHMGVGWPDMDRTVICGPFARCRRHHGLRRVTTCDGDVRRTRNDQCLWASNLGVGRNCMDSSRVEWAIRASRACDGIRPPPAGVRPVRGRVAHHALLSARYLGVGWHDLVTTRDTRAIGAKWACDGV